MTSLYLMQFALRTGMCVHISVEHHISNPSSLHLHLPFPVHNKYGLLQPYVRGNDGHTRCAYTPVPHLDLTSASTWLVYMHVTEMHVCKCITWYSKRFFVLNTTLPCMIILLCENACIYALGIQRVHAYACEQRSTTNPTDLDVEYMVMTTPL